MTRRKQKQTLGRKRGPVPPQGGRVRITINLPMAAAKVLQAMPGESWTQKAEYAVWRLDAIDSAKPISKGF